MPDDRQEEYNQFGTPDEKKFKYPYCDICQTRHPIENEHSEGCGSEE